MWISIFAALSGVKFLLDEKTGICGFTAEIDGRVVKAVCKEKQKAKVRLASLHPEK